MTHIAQENNFQVVVAANGEQSYAVFTYKCGGLNWTGKCNTSIGFSASSTFFANHPLSRQANATKISCLNNRHDCPEWSNVVYKIGEEPKRV